MKCGAGIVEVYQNQSSFNNSCGIGLEIIYAGYTSQGIYMSSQGFQYQFNFSTQQYEICWSEK